MGKVTSKYQVSLPKALADRLGIAPGDEVDWRIAGTELRVTPASTRTRLSVEERLKLFDAATLRQSKRKRPRSRKGGDRGWTREDLYDRDRTR